MNRTSPLAAPVQRRPRKVSLLTSAFCLLPSHFLLLTSAFCLLPSHFSSAQSLPDVIDSVQPRVVKIYGAGGLRGLEAYQSGFVISAEGHILTAWSYVLDTDFLAVVLADGRRLQAELIGRDPRLELAVLKVEAADLPHFDLTAGAQAETGDGVLAFSNLYGVAVGPEPASVLQGVVSAKAPLAARRGAFEAPYHGPVYILDAMTNNPGAAGGVLTTRDGRLLGMLGKELRSSLHNTWLNYALPAEALAPAVEDILAGRQSPPRDEGDRPSQNPVTLDLLGLVLVPDVLPKTPPFIDRVLPGSPAEAAGLRPDDIVLFVNGRIVGSCKAVREELAHVDRGREVRLTVQRGQELLEVMVRAEL